MRSIELSNFFAGIHYFFRDNGNDVILRDIPAMNGRYVIEQLARAVSTKIKGGDKRERHFVEEQ